MRRLADAAQRRRRGALGRRRSLILVPALHAMALSLFAGFGALARLSWPFFAALIAMASVAALVDLSLSRDPGRADRPFRLHFVLGGIFLAGAVGALWL